MAARIEHPTLYVEGPDGPVLLAARCAACGRASFPRQSFGCEGCGAHGDAMAPVEIAARGALISFAIVRKHMGGDIETPFAIGEVRLNDGPVIRCTLADGLEEAALRTGQKVVGLLAHNAKSSADVLELRFAPEGR
ncbi:MAG TPA: OB-fold domain-containing protein [Terricaulis sp.]|nr:OB-fold domain-containing protein [Terricaulis sp.]